MPKQQIQNVFHGRVLRRWLVIGGVTLVVLVLLLGSLPWIVAKTPLRQAMIPQLMPEFSGTSHVGAASLGWFSPLELTGVRLADADGQTLMEGAQLSVDRTLLGLLLQGVDGATLRLVDASINLVVLKDGSNWQRALQPLLASQSSSALPPAMTLQVSGAVVRIFDARGLQTGQISEWNLSGRYRPGEEFPLAVESSASISIPESGVPPGQVSAVMRLSPPEKPGEGGSGEVTLETSSLPIRSLAPLVARFVPTAMVSGQLTSTVTIDWNGTTAQVDGKLRGTELSFRSARHLAGDTLSLEVCDAVLQCKLDGERLQIDRCRLESHLAQIDLTATLLLASDGQAAEKSLLQFENVRATGEVDLAQLAAQLPSLLRIRHDAQVKSGRVKFTINSAAEGNDRRWDADLTVNSLTAIASGRPIRWQQPVSLQLAVLQQANGQLKGNLKCQCEYLSIEATGSTADGTIAAAGDLTRLTADLRPLIDLGGLHLAGRFDASIDFKRVLDNKLDANGQMLVQGLEFSFPGWQPLREDRMTFRLQTEAALRQGKLSSIRAATLRIDSAGDSMELTLGSPVAPANLITGLPLKVRASGRIASWLRRMQTWFSLSEYHLQGAFDFTLSGLLGFTEVNLHAASVNIRDLQAEFAGHVIEEPSLLLTASGRWDRAEHQITAVTAAIRSPSFAVWTEKMNVRLAGAASGPPVAEGKLFVRGELKKLQAWMTSRHETPKSILSGQLNGMIDLETRDDVTSGQCRLAVQNFEIYVPQNRSSGVTAAAATNVPRVQPAGWEPVWTDKELTITGRLQYAPREDRFSVENLKLASGPLQLMETNGSIEKLATTPVVDVQGRLHYDLARIAPLLRPYLDENIVLVGSGNRPFYYRGRLPSSAASQQEAAWWVGTEAGAGCSWDFLQLYGLRAGKGDLQATLKQGIVRVRPLDLPFGGGRLKTTPYLRFDNDPAVLTLSGDTELSGAVITDALCRDWLQYLAPALAEATRAQGQFSVQLKQSVIPLAAPQRSTLSGNLVIHSAQIRPGPLTAKIVALAAQIDAIIKRRPGTAGSTVLNITPQVVPFRMIEGRVEHQNFQIEIGDVVVRTSGYVGLDQSLSLVAEIPIRDKWVQRDPFLRGLKGQTLKIPIRGTLQKPRLDKQVIARLSRQMLQGAADGLLNDAIDRRLKKGLDQLFR